MAKQLPIDLALVQVAFEDREGDGQWFLDGETGDVVRLNDDDDDELAEQIEAGGARYIEIPYQGSEAGYRDMVEFIDSVGDNRMRALLEVAINGRRAFRGFKDVLPAYPEERERWFAFHNERVHRRILRWLDSEEIEPVTPEPSGN